MLSIWTPGSKVGGLRAGAPGEPKSKRLIFASTLSAIKDQCVPADPPDVTWNGADLEFYIDRICSDLVAFRELFPFMPYHIPHNMCIHII